MSSKRVRAARSLARNSKTAPRLVERLESRCVLSAIPIAAPLGMLPGPQLEIVDTAFVDHSVAAHDRFLDPQLHLLDSGGVDRMDSNSFGPLAPLRSDRDRGHDAVFGMSGAMNMFEAESPRIELAQSVFGMSPALSSGFLAPQYEIIVIYGTAPTSAANINNYVEVSAPDSLVPFNSRPEVSVNGASKPAIGPSTDSSPRASLAGGPSFSGGVAPARPLVAENLPAAASNASSAALVHFGSTPQLTGGNLQSGGATSRSVQPLQERIVIHTTQGAVLSSNEADDDGGAAAEAPSAAVEETPLRIAAVAAAAKPAVAISINIPADRTSLADVPMNLRGVEQALKIALSRLSAVGAELHDWLDDAHFSPLIAAVAGAALGAGGAAYLRRRGTTPSDEHDEEASSSWLFARLQTLPGDR
jgi:hypothetical protein